jgi:hypothetical protein
VKYIIIYSTIRDAVTCLVTGIQRAGRRRAPDGYGLGTRTDGPERLRRPARPP